tara:strand:- start:139 stop:654 length:516 start_codon:yes stop_codon:yes gene_type:complete
MTIIKSFFNSFIHLFPVLILFFLAFTGFDLNFSLFKNDFSFNFIYIVIFYWALKKPEAMGFGLIFIAGIINDVVQNYPIGISSINFLLLCVIASFIRTRTLLPNLLYDWGFFLIGILIVSSINYLILTLIFIIKIEYGTLMMTSFITFLIYPITAKIFNGIYFLDVRKKDA